MNTAAKKKQSARRFAAVASGWWMMAVCAVGAITGIVVFPVNAGASDLDYVKVSHSIDATDVKPFMIGSKRYVAMSKSFSHRPAPTDPIRIYQADANWAVGALVTTASNATRDVSGVYVFPALGDNKVLFWGAFDNYNGDRGFISQYDFNTSTWTERIINGGAYVGRIIYRPADSMFYIATSFTLPGHRHYNNLYKTTAANLFTQSNWITVNQPSWPAGKPVESFFSISGEYLYLLQYYSSEYYWQLSKWDFASTWTAIESNHDGTPAPRQDAIPSIAANDGLIVVAESYRTPSPQWRIRTSADGVTWKTAYSLDLLSTTGSRENVCDTYVLGKLFMIWVTSCESTNGYALISDQSGNFRKLMGVTSHYLESSIGDVLTDGTTIVTGGQNPYSNTQLNLFKKAAP